MADQQHMLREDSRTLDRSPTVSRLGALLCGATAVLSGFACWFWLIPQLLTESRPQLEIGSMVSEMAEVLGNDLTGALPTMNLTGSVIARLQKGTRDCGARLAWVTLSRPNGNEARRARLRSGNYFSPPFTITTMPVRVAIPYPAPYESGRGVLTILGADENLTVALTPAWHVPANTGTATHAVTWHPVANCTKP